MSKSFLDQNQIIAAQAEEERKMAENQRLAKKKFVENLTNILTKIGTATYKINDKSLEQKAQGIHDLFCGLEDLMHENALFLTNNDEAKGIVTVFKMCKDFYANFERSKTEEKLSAFIEDFYPVLGYLGAKNNNFAVIQAIKTTMDKVFKFAVGKLCEDIKKDPIDYRELAVAEPGNLEYREFTRRAVNFGNTASTTGDSDLSEIGFSNPFYYYATKDELEPVAKELLLTAKKSFNFEPKIKSELLLFAEELEQSAAKRSRVEEEARQERPAMPAAAAPSLDAQEPHGSPIFKERGPSQNI